MATGRLRMQVAALTSVLAVAALLAGPGMTWGLDVPAVGGSGGTTGQLAATAQGVVTTAEQTVESTVTTVQAAAPATVMQETVPSPVQTTAPTVTAQPAPPAPVQKKTPAAATLKTPVTRRSEKAPRAGKAPQSTGGTLRQAVRTPVLKGAPRTAAKAKLLPTASPGARPAAPEPTPQCGGLPALPVLGGIDLGALVTIVCDARNLLTPARVGTGRAADAPVSIGDLLGAAVSGRALAYARAALLHRYPGAAGDDQRGLAAGDGDRAASLARAGRAGAMSPSPVAYPGAVLTQLDPISTRLPKARATQHRHSGVFSTPVDGTGMLSLVLMLDSALLVAIVLWRMARRWLVPRFA